MVGRLAPNELRRSVRKGHPKEKESTNCDLKTEQE